MKLAASGSSGDGRLDYKRREEIRAYRKDYTYIYILYVYIYIHNTSREALGEALRRGGRSSPPVTPFAWMCVSRTRLLSPTHRRTIVSDSSFFLPI